MREKWKRSLSLALGAALALGALALSGCSGVPGAAPRSGAGVSVAGQSDMMEIDHSVAIEPTVLIDLPEVTVTVDSATFRNDNLYLDITAVNKTALPIDITAGTLGFSANYINNYMVETGYLLMSLDPNQTLTDDISFNATNLVLYGIKQIGEIGIGFSIRYDEPYTGSGSANHDQIFQEVVSLKTNLYDEADMSSDTYPDAVTNPALLSLFDGQMLSFNRDGGFDQSGISIKSLGLFKNKDDDVSVMVEVQNNGETLVGVRASDISIDGKMVYEGSWTGNVVVPGKIAVMGIDLNGVADMGDMLANSESDSGDSAGEGDDQQFDFSRVSTVGIEFSAQDESFNTVVAPTQLEFSF